MLKLLEVQELVFRKNHLTKKEKTLLKKNLTLFYYIYTAFHCKLNTPKFNKLILFITILHK